MWHRAHRRNLQPPAYSKPSRHKGHCEIPSYATISFSCMRNASHVSGKCASCPQREQNWFLQCGHVTCPAPAGTRITAQPGVGHCAGRDRVVPSKAHALARASCNRTSLSYESQKASWITFSGSSALQAGTGHTRSSRRTLLACIRLSR